MTNYYFAASLSFGSVLLAAGCGSSQSTSDSAVSGANADVGSATLIGSGGNFAFTPLSATAANFDNGKTLSVVLSDRADYCAVATAGKYRPSQRTLEFIFLRTDSQGEAIALTTGSYSVLDPNNFTQNTVAIGGSATDSSCRSIPSSVIDDSVETSGTIELTDLTSESAIGRYSLKIGSESHSGAFTAPICAGLAKAIEDQTSIVCSND